MQREIKFRAWDGKNMYVPSLVFSGGSFVIGYEDDSGCAKGLVDDPIMQYTGLKDKNGVEIYDGDILSFGYWNNNPSEGVCMYRVFWREDEAAFAVQAIGIDEGPLSFCAFDGEVIGNIYQNPELLEQKQ